MQNFNPDFTPGPQALIYKTKGDYRNFVPVLLSDDKTEIVSYPNPSDLTTNGTLAKPTALKKNYWLDNRGIGKNVAFLKLTYEEYSKLPVAPSLKELLQMIVDKDPLVELCDCGNRTKYTDAKGELNKAIEAGALRQKCKIIK